MPNYVTCACAADFWASVELAQRSILTGWVLLVPARTSFVRLFVAFLTSLAVLMWTLTARPYRRNEDNWLSVAATLLLLLTYFCSMQIKVFEDFSEATGLLGDPELTQRVLGFASTHGFIALLVLFAFALLVVMFVSALTTARSERARRIVDPRWDASGFSRWATRGRIKFLRIGYLRQLVSGDSVPPRTYADVPANGCYIGTPPSFVDIIAVVTMPMQLQDQTELSALVAQLGDSADDDCIYLPQLSITKESGSRQEQKAAKVASAGALRVHSFFSVRTLVCSSDELYDDGQQVAAQ